MISLEDVKNAAGVVELVGGLAMCLVALWAKVNFTPRTEHKAAVDRTESRLTAVEALAAQCATREQLASLQADYRELKTRVEAVDGRLDDSLPQIRTALTRIEDYLLSKGKS